MFAVRNGIGPGSQPLRFGMAPAAAFDHIICNFNARIPALVSHAAQRAIEPAAPAADLEQRGVSLQVLGHRALERVVQGLALVDELLVRLPHLAPAVELLHPLLQFCQPFGIAAHAGDPLEPARAHATAFRACRRSTPITKTGFVIMRAE